MKVYFNIRTNYGVETVDEISLTDFNTPKEFSMERRRLAGEYRMAGMQVYTSSRCTKEWRDK